MAKITEQGQMIIAALMATIGEKRLREMFSSKELDVVVGVEPKAWPPEIAAKVKQAIEDGWGSLKG